MRIYEYSRNLCVAVRACVFMFVLLCVKADGNKTVGLFSLINIENNLNRKKVKRCHVRERQDRIGRYECKGRHVSLLM